MKKLRWNTVGGFTAAGLLGLAALPAQAQSSVEIFGDLSQGFVHQTGTNGPSTKYQSSLSWANSFGFRGREDLGGGTQAIFMLNASIDTGSGVVGTAGSTFFKNAYVGLSNPQWGTVMFGRNDELMSMLCSLDVMCWRGLIESLRPANLDRVGGSQLSNMVRYHSPDFGPVRFKAYVTTADRTTGSNGRASGIQADYRTENLQVGAAYETINNVTLAPGSAGGGFGLTSFFGASTSTTPAFPLDKLKITGLGARYTMSPVTFYALWTKIDMQYKGAEQAMKTYNLGLGYQLSQPLELSGGCSRITFDPSRWTTCEVRVTYSFSKRTSIFLADVHEKSSGAFARPQLFLEGGFGSVSGSTNLIGAGIRHIF